MKIIGLLLILVASISLQSGLSMSGIGLLLIGLALTLSDVIFFWMKEEIRSSHRKR